MCQGFEAWRLQFLGLDRMKAVDVMACLKRLLGQRGRGAFGQELFRLESGRRLRTEATRSHELRGRPWGEVL